MKPFKRVFLVVVDSLGIGSRNLPGYDFDANTLQHIIKSYPSLKTNTLDQLGIRIIADESMKLAQNKIGYAAALQEASIGKDTMTGHWEMMGLQIDKPFLTFTETGFPKELIRALEEACGHKVVGNKAASGTEILDELGEHQMKTGDMIVYTSADSVLQICGHEETFGLEELYRCCEIARELTMRDEWKVGRVIARPYVGEKAGEFVRTANRHDYALKPFGKTALNIMMEHGLQTIGIGKIRDIFDGEGIASSYSSKSSVHGMLQTIDMLKEDFTGLCFTNLVDFDALWGHRRKPVEYGKELEVFDRLLHHMMSEMKEDDLLIVSADHGNDPTYVGTDHTKELVPMLAYSPSMKSHKILTERDSFADIGATILENFGLAIANNMIGKSFFDDLN